MKKTLLLALCLTLTSGMLMPAAPKGRGAAKKSVKMSVQQKKAAAAKKRAVEAKKKAQAQLKLIAAQKALNKQSQARIAKLLAENTALAQNLQQARGDAAVNAQKATELQAARAQLLALQGQLSLLFIIPSPSISFEPIILYGDLLLR